MNAIISYAKKYPAATVIVVLILAYIIYSAISKKKSDESGFKSCRPGTCPYTRTDGTVFCTPAVCPKTGATA